VNADEESGGIACLEEEVARLRSELDEVKRQLAELRALLA
jgi:ribosomal protein L29